MQEPAWASLERELAQRGIATDVSSVIDAALSHPDEGVRWAAVELLGRRRDRGAEEPLLKILTEDESRLVRETAALSLVRLGRREALAEARELIDSSEDPERQLHLAAQLAELGDFSGYDYVFRAARSKDEHLRFLSAGALLPWLSKGFSGDRAHAGPRQLLIGLLKDSSPKVRKEALLELSVGVYQGIRVRPFLRTVRQIGKRDPDPEVREQARLHLLAWKQALNAEGEP